MDFNTYIEKVDKLCGFELHMLNYRVSERLHQLITHIQCASEYITASMLTYQD